MLLLFFDTEKADIDYIYYTMECGKGQSKTSNIEKESCQKSVLPDTVNLFSCFMVFL